MNKKRLDGTHNIYNGMNKESEGTKSEDLKYGDFGIKGKPDFGLLKNLKKDGFKELSPILRRREIPKETYVYSSNSAMIILYVNRKTHYHKVNITAKEVLENSNTIENTKSLVEKTLGFELTDSTKPISDLIKEVGEN